MRIAKFLLLAAHLCLAGTLAHADEKAKKVLLVTHSAGFVHSSVVEAEKVLKEIGPKNGFEVDCFRYTNDPQKPAAFKKKIDGKEETVKGTALEAYSEQFQRATKQPVSSAQTGRLNAETLRQYDAVFFFTTGNPVESKEDMAALLDYIKSGKGFVGTHCATDTLYSMKEYGDLIGAYFDGHPWHTKVKVIVEDPKHPIASHLGDSFEITDEIYQFRDPYSRDKLRVLMRLDPLWVAQQRADEPKRVEAEKEKLREQIAKAEGANKTDEVLKLRAKLKEKENFRPGIRRTDNDYAIAWVRSYGKGRVFYTALGHREEVWRDPRFQQMLLQGLRWATGQLAGPADPLPLTSAQ
jgi:type 1 glutamine amidotransferase